jgi:hypothetical protein
MPLAPCEMGCTDSIQSQASTVVNSGAAEKYMIRVAFG